MVLGTSQATALSPAKKHQAALQVADFLHSQFGVQTLAAYGRSFESDESLAAPLSVRTLSYDETLARLATGIKRFRLPDEFNYLRLFRQVARDGSRSEATRALQALASIYENRRQYPKAADVWREVHRALVAARKIHRRSGSTRSWEIGAASSRRRPSLPPRAARPLPIATANGSSWKRTRLTSKSCLRT